MEGVVTKITIERAEGGDALIDAVRRWAGRPLDVGCESCGGAFYNKDGDPVCFGCRRGDDYQLGLVRARLLRVLGRRRD